MADTEIDSLETNLNFLYCSICYSIFKLPKVLPCQHTFCYHCLESYIHPKTQNLPKGRKIVQFPCPLCQRPVQCKNDSLSVGKWAEYFETNFTFTSIIDDLLADKRRKESRPLCDIHSTKRVKYFCRVCNLLLCSLCTAKRHKNCAVVQTLSEAVTDMSHMKSQLCEQLKTKKTELQKVSSDLVELRASMTANKKQLIREIENDAEFIAKLLHELQQRKKEAINELESIYSAHQFDLTDAKCQSTIDSISACQSLIDQNATEDISDAAFLQRMSDAKQKYNELPDTVFTTPNRQIITFQPDSCLHEQLQRLVKQPLGKIFLQNPGVQLSNANSSVVDTETRNTLTEETADNMGPSVLLNNLSTMSTEENSLFTDVTLLRDGLLALTDSIRYQIKVFTFDGELVNQIQLQNAPWGICRILDDEIAVTVPNKRYIKYMAYTDRLIDRWTAKTTKKYLGIVALDEKSFVCASAGDSCVDIVSMNGAIIQSFQKIFTHPTYVALTAEHNIVVTDSYKKSLICCDRQGNERFRYSGGEGQGLTEPVGICVNQQGNIFVADAKSHNIYKIQHLSMLTNIRDLSLTGLDISPENKLILTFNDEKKSSGISIFRE